MKPMMNCGERHSWFVEGGMNKPPATLEVLWLSRAPLNMPGAG